MFVSIDSQLNFCFYSAGEMGFERLQADHGDHFSSTKPTTRRSPSQILIARSIAPIDRAIQSAELPELERSPIAFLNTPVKLFRYPMLDIPASQ